MQYKLVMVETRNPNFFAKEVQKYLDDGWKLYGDPFYAGMEEGVLVPYPRYCQALIKNDKVKAKVG